MLRQASRAMLKLSNPCVMSEMISASRGVRRVDGAGRLCGHDDVGGGRREGEPDNRCQHRAFLEGVHEALQRDVPFLPVFNDRSV